MILSAQSLRSRAFVIQFFALMAEFGHEIPWLQPLQGLQYATNREHFRDQLLQRLCRHDEEIVPLQLLTPDRSRTFVGSILHFPRSPEVFQDPKNRQIAAALNEQGYQYISCLQIRDVHRQSGHGNVLMRRVLRSIRKEQGQVWGVVSQLPILAWYKNLGATVHSSFENQDNLWIVSWPKDA
ncbi:MAG: hypothetical protein WCV85_05390 [Patescibacteria group bacterium]|jgi:hypothetical protein